MVGSALLEREIEKVSDEIKEVAGKSVTEEELRHRNMMSQNYRTIFGESSLRDPAPEAPQKTEEPAPAVPSSPDAPSASARLADYNRAMQNILNMRSGSTAEAPAQERTYTPMRDFAPYVEPKTPTYEEKLYHEGILMGTTLSPETETVEPPYYSPSYMPSEDYKEEEDALPTRRTMESIQQSLENEAKTSGFSALSAKTKIVLATVAAAVVLLLAVICINTAVIKSIRSGVAMRENTVAELSETLARLESEIAELTSPEKIESWAAEHGMTPPES